MQENNFQCICKAKLENLLGFFKFIYQSDQLNVSFLFSEPGGSIKDLPSYTDIESFLKSPGFYSQKKTHLALWKRNDNNVCVKTAETSTKYSGGEEYRQYISGTGMHEIILFPESGSMITCIFHISTSNAVLNHQNLKHFFTNMIIPPE